MRSTGYIIAAGGIVLANDAIFIPLETGQAPLTSVNWRIVPATAIMALVVGGIESLNEGFGTGLGMLVLLSVLVIPLGHAGSPLENMAKVFGRR